ncbi:MAG: Rrf2 family transcriptional regulator [Clostridiales Family XIII bacterium]|jgi:Rrf2 family protein|nr:Rrf2 family transcriptional regulator [Clostridiales Family XIII bacterium]
MLITRETDYAIRALRALVCGEKKTLAAICKEETIPQQFGYKILKKLANAGYVTIKRGKEGGYIISEDFPKTTLLDLTKVMESPTDISPCVIPGYICESHRPSERPCKVNIQLSAMQQALNEELGSVNLLDLLKED